MNTDQTVQLINLLSKKRTESGLSIAEVARRAHVDVAAVWGIEQGMIATPRAESLIAIGGVLGIPSADIFATVGWLTEDALPDIKPYLRAKYGRLPEDALAEIEDHITKVVTRYQGDNADSDRPRQIVDAKEH